MQYVDLVAILALIQYFFFSFITGQARSASGIKAPAITGDEGFERMYRVQANTLETLVLFLPALFIAAKYWPSLLIAGAGVVYIVGRFIYWRAYVKEPSSRGLGFVISVAPIAVLLALGLVGSGLNFQG